MSIQPVRVVARMVEEVARAPRVVLPYVAVELPGGAIGNGSGEIVEIVRSPLAAPPHFASLFHFWTHALRGFLERRGEGDQLEPVAGQAMGLSSSGAELLADVVRSTARLGRAPSALPGIDTAAIREAYRMIDGTCRRSWVAASEGEWIAVFWAHGFVRPRTHVENSRPGSSS